MPPSALNFSRCLTAAGCPPPISPVSKGSLHHFLRLAAAPGSGQSVSGFCPGGIGSPAPPSELVIEMGAARLRLESLAQLPLAARLLQLLQEGQRC